MALGLNSFYSKQALTSAHENIKVLRHPDHAKVGVFLWAHHEKIVCVDQTYAFVGGVDLCYGRWDDFEHRLVSWRLTKVIPRKYIFLNFVYRLTDLGSATPTLDVSTLKKKTSTVPGGDNFYPIPTPYYQKCEIQINQPEPEPDLSDDDSEPELPQLQPGDQLLMPNFAQNQLNTPVAERKYGITSITTKVKLKGKEILNMMYAQNEDSLDEPDHSAVNLAANNEDEDTDLCGSAKYWIGKDYVNFIVKDFTELESPLVDFIDRNTTPRMPWHDIAVCVQGSSARDIARHFIQRWNATKLEKARLNNSYPYLLPKSYNMDPVPDILQLEQYKVTCQVCHLYTFLYFLMKSIWLCVIL